MILCTENHLSDPNTIGLHKQSDDEIDLKQVVSSLLRYKGLIAKITAATFVLSGIYAFTTRPVWEGQFEIVVANSKSSTSQAGPGLRSR